MRSFILILACLVLLNTSVSRAQDDCTPIATVYGRDICEAHIAISEKAAKDVRAYAEKNDRNPDKAVHGLMKANLFNIIWEEALNQKFGEKTITPTKSEIGTYVSSMAELKKKQRQYDGKIAALVKKLISENDYNEDNYRQLNRIGVQAQQSVKFYDTQEKSLTPEMKALKAEAEQKAAFTALKSWKVQKLLYETYGGDIIFQQGGLEPIEAFEDFLDEIQDSDKVVIHDRAYRDVYDPIEDYIDADHNEVPNDAPEIEAYFSNPFWALNDDLFEQGFLAVERKIKAIPTLSAKEETKK